MTPAFFLFMHNYGFSILGALLLVSSLSLGQTSPAKPAAKGASSQSSQHALELAKSGNCSEAVPLLKKALAQSTDKEFRRNAGLLGIRCAMVKNQFDTAEDFLRMLKREFPDDPEVLYTAVHTYSDFATRSSMELATRAPNSAEAHELKAEAFETQGKWDQADKEYQRVVQQNPQLPGIHFRIGRLLLSEPNPPADVAEQAKKEFQQELQIDPSNAGAEYVLGELAREAQQWDEAIAHFTRAAKLDSSFGDAYLGWGVALVSTKKFSDAVHPLELAVKLEPQNPAAHYNLAIAYTRTGRKEEGEHEFAIHRGMVQKQPAEGADAQGQPAANPQ
ncbi:MAG TPA: tetratricopeptide repeat protein [Terriglobales bacterium]|nr:tetratricopeptide repeat protein [Terriglobales bacterium]